MRTRKGEGEGNPEKIGPVHVRMQLAVYLTCTGHNNTDWAYAHVQKAPVTSRVIRMEGWKYRSMEVRKNGRMEE